ncbi:hypothetical protein OEZ85_004004 [Tetradesmus obliquus]|uniref:valine--tRNA ligase n=1 Tax=Tetradesmus obliquus TaxID=3088 RepID=A0ABY8UDE2_TETOB|nr:hypothetical protein OEZ85_004004 [Tetradesmus obliquus]
MAGSTARLSPIAATHCRGVATSVRSCSIIGSLRCHQQQQQLQARRCSALAAVVREASSAATAEAASSSNNGAPSAAAAAGARPNIQLPKNFDPAEREQQLYKWWEESGFFAPDPAATGPAFTIPMPPPNVTGKLHMGHAMFVTLQDVMARYARMAGKQTLWLPGTDHAGIATQNVVEKQLEAEGSSRAALGREAFEERVWQWKEQYGGFITNQLRRLGASCDWSRERFTLDAGLSDAVAEAFVQLADKGLVYRGAYMVNWSPRLGTAVSDLEVEYSEEPGHLFFFKYPLADSDTEEYLPVATTRPETILGDTAVAVNPADERFNAYVGRRVTVPMSGGRTIPVIADDYVDMEFGTGALKITPGHDPNDYEIGKRVGLETINIMNKDGSLNAAAGAYAGMDRFDARQQLWKDMEAAGLVIKKEAYTTRVPRSQRGGEVVEPLVSEQWFVRMAPLAEPALAAVADGSITIMPERFEKIYNMWLENIKDWCVSRQLWWGHRIPVWYVHASQADADSAEEGRSDRYIVARNAAEAAEKAAAQWGQGLVLVQEPDVLDTWFSSGLWPFSTLGWPNSSAADLKQFYPTQVLETGHDILFFWVARMIMMGMGLTGQAPFSTVYLHGLVRDDKGRKMSKSLGNVIDPLDVVAQYGTDALRFTMATGTTAGQDLNLSLDRVNSNRNFTNKLWNAGKFILFQLEGVSDAEWQQLSGADFSSSSSSWQGLSLSDRWVLSSLHQLVDQVTACQERFDFNEAGQALYSWAWGEFADWYVEASKARLYSANFSSVSSVEDPDGGGSAVSADPHAAGVTRGVLVYAFNVLLRLVHPFMPFITEELWQALPHRGVTLMKAAWPSHEAAGDAAAVTQFEQLKELVRGVRNARTEYGLEQARKVAAVLVVSDPQLREVMQQELPVVCLLAKLEPSKVSVVGSAEEASAAAPAGGCVSVVVNEGLQLLLPLAGLFDVDKELARLTKQKAKVEKELGGIMGRLNNPKTEIKPGVFEGYWQWQGHKIRYQCSGDSGEPVLLVHGFGGNCDHWRKNTPQLGQRFRAFSIDLLGYGFSDKPDPRQAPPNSIYNFDNWGQQLVDFTEQVIGAPAYISCNSVGGLAGLKAGILRPDLVRGVQLINISLRGLHVERQQPWQRPLVAAFQRLLRETSLGSAFFGSVATPRTVKNILCQAYADDSAVTDELVDAILKPGLQPGAVDVFLDFISYSGGPLPEQLLAATPPSVPVSILWGAADPWEDMAEGRRLFAHYPCVTEFVELPGVGHCPQDEAPHLVNPLIEAFVLSSSSSNSTDGGSSSSTAAAQQQGVAAA